MPERAGSVDIDGRRRTFTVVSPEAQTARAPGILVFHGSNQSGDRIRSMAGGKFDEWATRDGVVVAYLDGYKGHWNDARVESPFAARKDGIDDVAFAEAVIEWMSTEYQIDASRVYAVGFSNGGQLVIRLLHEIPKLLAGVAIIAATQPAPANFLLGDSPVVPLPTLTIHGTKDPLVPFAGGMASIFGLRPRGLGLSAHESADYYARRNGIPGAPVKTTISPEVVRWDYQADGHPPVAFYEVEGGGHGVPGPAKGPRIMGHTTGDLVTSDAIAEFFALRPPIRA